VTGSVALLCCGNVLVAVFIRPRFYLVGVSEGYFWSSYRSGAAYNRGGHTGAAQLVKNLWTYWRRLVSTLRG